MSETTSLLRNQAELGQSLVARGLLTDEKLAAAMAEQSVTKERLGKILVRNGFIRQDDLFKALLELEPDELHHEAIYTDLIPPEVLIDTKSMVMLSSGRSIHIGTLSSPHRVRSIIKNYLPGWDIHFSTVNPERLDEYLSNLHASTGREVLTWERIFQEAMKAGASDIHVLPRNESYTVKTRIDGVLHLTHEGSMEEYLSLISRVKDLARMDMAERRRPQDGGFSLEHNGRVISFRVSTVPTIDGERMIVRILDGESTNISLNGLGITRLDDWKRITGMPDGLCLICGPTGSGKSTTLAATARQMNFLERAIYSIEDPVENRIPYAAQVNVNQAIGLDFAAAIRNFMRADPDVIIVGEVRDIDTARNALKAAETGHLVLATLHTGSITNSVSRLRDIGVEPYELRHLLRGIMVQRLLRVYCTRCNGKGCERCNNTGYSGREVVSEVVRLRDEHEVDRVINGEIFWTSLLHDARDKVLEGRTSEKEFERVFGLTLKDVEEMADMGGETAP